ncbi:MAG: bifunctional riboflavin kinase/FAD synthetase [Cyanobacteriota bacterium]
MIPLHSPGSALRPTALALGSFDGLHRGHRRVIEAVVGAGSAGPAQDPRPTATDPVPTVVSFWPHPREVLHGETRLRLDLPGEKLALLEPLGIRQLVLVPFDHALAALTPEAFVEEVLEGQLQARRIAVGENFRFGAGRQGDASDLVRLGRQRGMEVVVLPMLWEGPERVSSSRIRRALAAGRIDEARHLLERPYRFGGRVVTGRGLGRGLGWPTANLAVDGRKFLPREGVYAAWAWRSAGGPEECLPGEGPMAAVMNLGPQPTVDPQAPSAVEVHVLDRTLELVGEHLIVEPVALLRDQQRFDGLEALRAQIGADAERARLLLGSEGSGATGVGMGQSPPDEGGDPADQQNS